ncbi:mitochondrial carrier domain-containing protein [Halteromyces radiatus]|uniref:mitochondrial carrier domain-containing protein n=1 Tax=Halteromyces radiatus TaxID=101107 RepID=UPI00221FFE04|nr:mitochondrial carrier domain-containing protein [Halteromyces radiatus]KAI8099849.1 mitochondrial carrier domain-containing protein [Halteromyces radiatus]
MTTKNLSNQTLHSSLYSHQSLFGQILQANRTVVAASCAATSSVLSGFPFDSVKTRMQTHSYDSIMACVKTTYKEEGARGFFRGILPPLVTVSMIKSVSFTVYESSKTFFRTHTSLQGDTLRTMTPLATISGGCSGAFVAFLSCPLELVKIQRQLEQVLLKQQQAVGNAVTVESSSWRAAKKIVQRKGIFGLWNGLPCHSARDTLGTAFYFGSYETTKRLLSGPTKESGPLTHFFAGGMCGVLSWLFVFPIDLVKSVMQKDVMMTEPKYKNATECAKDIARRQGVKGLYRGLTVTLIRAFPIHSLNFLVYEEVLRLIPSL